ncbi:MAG TPA: hypothetical protein VE981_15905, partial [Planctomycetota bacterium]|nr:hypothetical protein [Planctomycetota bacterium]
MFSDRAWIAKAAAALLVFAWLSVDTARTLDDLHPELERTARFTEDLREKTIVLWGRKVLTSDATGFEVGSRAGPIRVLTPHPPPAGVHVSAVARPTGP